MSYVLLVFFMIYINIPLLVRRKASKEVFQLLSMPVFACIIHVDVLTVLTARFDVTHQS